MCTELDQQVPVLLGFLSDPDTSDAAGSPDSPSVGALVLWVRLLVSIGFLVPSLWFC